MPEYSHDFVRELAEEYGRDATLGEVLQALTYRAYEQAVDARNNDEAKVDYLTGRTAASEGLKKGTEAYFDRCAALDQEAQEYVDRPPRGVAPYVIKRLAERVREIMQEQGFSEEDAQRLAELFAEAEYERPNGAVAALSALVA